MTYFSPAVSFETADLWLAQYRDCGCEPLCLTMEKARFVLAVHAGHGPACREYLGASAFVAETERLTECAG
ncbi:hypothetical protein JK358_36155 [Nocardia sp. 2]|uniref:Uncharacterized protein n=1 Tax=Nocardia acididurans TaxID=2802282 RepID=A0ABS1MGV8_9NOCA|nr:hypothetical protein [Nocardia acididurans]MBL1079847.1 hypothetical protein [Nocardia acididurans]